MKDLFDRTLAKPIRRNSPSSPELFSVGPTQCDFERERTQLIAPYIWLQEHN